MDIEKMDPNLAAISGNCEGVKFISAHDERISLHGVYFDKADGLYKRVPAEIAINSNEYVVALGKMTAGGRVRFITDSPYIAIKASIPYFSIMSHMTITASHGFAVYADGFFQNRYSPTPKSFSGTFTSKDRIYFADKKPLLKPEGKKLIEVYFPLYGGVSELHIGIDPNCSIEKAPDYKVKKPMVFYGSSITQGACVSRPGNDYISIIGRRLNADYVNLGFSGNGKAETTMIDYVNSFDGSLFVYNYYMFKTHPEIVLPPHYSIYERIREKHPDVPILFADMPQVDYMPYPEREEIIRASYEKALANGDKNVGYVPSYEMYGEGERDCCTVDGLHPNDLGAMRIADAFTPVIKKLLTK